MLSLDNSVASQQDKIVRDGPVYAAARFNAEMGNLI